VSPEQQIEILDALEAINPAESQSTLIADGTTAILSILGCSPASALALLNRLRKHGQIKLVIVRVGSIPDECQAIPANRWRWSRGLESVRALDAARMEEFRRSMRCDACLQLRDGLIDKLTAYSNYLQSHVAALTAGDADRAHDASVSALRAGQDVMSARGLLEEHRGRHGF
jgi:hypothetical protein